MSGSYDYNIIDVVKCLSLEVRHMNKADWDVDCPFCTVNPVNGHNGKGKLNICIPKDAFRCSRCDTHGGMLDLYTLVKGLTENRLDRKYLIISITVLLPIPIISVRRLRLNTTNVVKTEPPRRRLTVHTERSCRYVYSKNNIKNNYFNADFPKHKLNTLALGQLRRIRNNTHV